MQRQKLKLLSDKRGMGLGEMYPAVLTIVLIGIVLGIGLYVLSKVEGNITNEAAGDAVNTTIAGLDDFADWIAIIVVVMAAAIILGVVMSSFGRGATGI